MQKILVFMLLSLSLLNPTHCMEEEKDPEIETSYFEILPLEVKHFIFTMLIEGHFNNCNDVFDLYSFDKNFEFRKTLASIKLVSKFFFTFNKEELEKFIIQTRNNKLDSFQNCIKNQYTGLSYKELNAQLLYLLNDIRKKKKSEVSEVEEELKKSAGLILAGANINLQDKYGSTALILAALNGYTEIVQLLLDYMADINLQDNDGQTALMIATLNGHTETVKLLLGHNADIDLRDNSGWTALIRAARYGHTQAAQILLDHNANIDTQNKFGWTALILAALNGHLETVQLLLYYGANINLQNRYKSTALMSAVKDGYTKIVRLLLDHNANIGLQDHNGKTALMLAAERGHTEIVKLLQNKLDQSKKIRCNIQ